MSHQTAVKPVTIEQIIKELHHEHFLNDEVICTRFETFYEVVVKRESEAYAVGISHPLFQVLQAQDLQELKATLLQKLHAVGL
ncbi:hypothetical protein [Metabacillus iocasae]|uniref:Uncharacterized protein n=1 Tax=Priestia iocasae TaxID=2291674 RepID=A0ABS2QSQ8_9BACI|nr:hypothetical protein [Metabacillus iocasae]MBM7702243.1 hypothetical protein [Metabacillus iocasae]